MNTVTLTGRLTSEPVLRYRQRSNSAPGESVAVAKFNLAVDRGRHDGTDFIPITLFGKQAEICTEHLGKGHLVAIRGELRQSTWTTEQGESKSRLEVNGQEVDFLSRPRSTRTHDTQDTAGAS